MTLYVYANYNVLAGFFGPFVCERIEPDEMVKDYAQIVSGIPEDGLKKLQECDLYCMGSFDNVSGELKPEKTFLLHCGEVVERFLKGSEEDGKERN